MGAKGKAVCGVAACIVRATADRREQHVECATHENDAVTIGACARMLSPRFAAACRHQLHCSRIGCPPERCWQAGKFLAVIGAEADLQDELQGCSYCWGTHRA